MKATLEEQAQTADMAERFILKLVRADNLKPSEQIQAICDQLIKIEQEPYFPNFLNMIDPENHYS